MDKPLDPVEKIRDHLANERTFLAWTRTSIAIMAFGFVIEKFSLFLKQIKFYLSNVQINSIQTGTPGYSAYFGVFLVAFGSLVILLALIKYKKVENQINTESFKPTIFIDFLLAFLIFTVGIFLTIYLLAQVY